MNTTNLRELVVKAEYPAHVEVIAEDRFEFARGLWTQGYMLKRAVELASSIESNDAALQMLARHRAASVAALLDEIDRLREALKPFARLRPPARCEGNAAIYSILHKDILRARAALGDKS